MCACVPLNASGSGRLQRASQDDKCKAIKCLLSGTRCCSHLVFVYNISGWFCFRFGSFCFLLCYYLGSIKSRPTLWSSIDHRRGDRLFYIYIYTQISICHDTMEIIIFYDGINNGVVSINACFIKRTAHVQVFFFVLLPMSMPIQFFFYYTHTLTHLIARSYRIWMKFKTASLSVSRLDGAGWCDTCFMNGLWMNEWQNFELLKSFSMVIWKQNLKKKKTMK